MEENTMHRGAHAASNKRQSSSLATAVARLCSCLRDGFAARRNDSDGKTNAPESQTPMAEPTAVWELDDPELDRLACAVFERLALTRESDVTTDPQAALFAIAAEVARRWPTPATPPEDTSTAPIDAALLGKRVAELDPLHRAALLRHVNEGLTYRQIAHCSGTSPDQVLAQLRAAYSQLRLSLARSSVTARKLPGVQESAES